MIRYIFIIFLLINFSACAEIKSTSNDIQKFVNDVKKGEQKYVNGVSDLPLYRGFKPLADNKNTFYDTPDGKIVEATYEMSGVRASEVKKYYMETLPELGWEMLSNEEYEREGENLQISVDEQGKKTILKIFVKPTRRVS